MAENLYVGSHKGTTKAFRDGWERTFSKKEKESEDPQRCLICGGVKVRYVDGTYFCPSNHGE